MIDTTSTDLPTDLIAPKSDVSVSPPRNPTSPRFARAREWSKLIAITGTAQVAVQAIGFASGILIIRLLPTHEYAMYTLCNTMLGTMTILADGGIASGVMSEGGKVWQDKSKLGGVFAAGMELRKKFAIFSLLFSVPVLLYLLQKHGASWPMSLLLALSLMPAFLFALSGTLLQIAPKLHQDITSLQKIQLTASTGRLALNTLTLFVFPFAAVAILATGISQIYANVCLRRASPKYLHHSTKADAHARKEIVRVVKRVLPGSIYYCLSSQITIWLISLFGSTKAIAELGALGRLAMILSIFSILTATLLVPRFAKLPKNPLLVLTRFFQVQLGVMTFCCLIVASAHIFSEQALWILGGDYASLNKEVVLMAIASCTNLIVGTGFSLGVSRGIVAPPAIAIPLSITLQAIFIATGNLSSVSGVLLIVIYSAIGKFLIDTTYFVLAFRK